jgi:hypothetical protein
MSTPEKSTHWKSLAALLGTEAASESESASSETTSSPAPAPVPVPLPVQEKKPAPPRPSAPPAPARVPPPKPTVPKRSHWGKLANVLGLGGSPEPEAAEPEPERTPELESRPIAPPPEIIAPAAQTSDAAAMAAAHWDTPDQDRAVDPLEMTAEPFVDEALDAVDLESIGTREPEGEQAADERRRRRRRRRGRGRGRHGEGDSPPADRGTSRPSEPPVIAADAATDAVSELDEDLEEPTASEGEEQERPERVAGDRDEGGQRRRRRRRRGRRSRREEGETASSGRSESRPRSRDEGPSSRPSSVDEPVRKREAEISRLDADDDMDDLDEEESMEDMEGDDDLGDDGEGKGDDLHLSHKKIPSWFEAIEAVIATNMTSRANNPSSGSRNRGGSGRGRRDR